MSSNEPKKRLKAAESRRALLDAGLELLKSRGVAPGLDRVTLKEAIEVSGVPRSTAYRLYEGGKGQLEEFRADLLADLDNSVEAASTAAAIEQVAQDLQPMIESRDPEQLAFALREIIRVAVNVNLDAFSRSLEWRVFMSSLASLGTGVEAADPAAEAHRDAASDFGLRFMETFRELLRTFGLRPRSPLALEEFGVLVGAIVEGVALRLQIEPGLQSLKRPTGRNGEPKDWSAAAVAVEGLVLSWFEADPNMVSSADLRTWTAF